MSHDADEAPCEKVAGRIWDEKARDLYQERRLQVAAFDGEQVISAQVWGSCPRAVSFSAVRRVCGDTPVIVVVGRAWRFTRLCEGC